MNLHDPLRPRLANGRLAWLNGVCYLPSPEVEPQADGTFLLSLWLPIEAQTYTARRCAKIFWADELLRFLTDFCSDPEGTCESHFNSGLTELKLRQRYALTEGESQGPAPSPRSKSLPSRHVKPLEIEL